MPHVQLERAGTRPKFRQTAINAVIEQGPATSSRRRLCGKIAHQIRHRPIEVIAANVMVDLGIVIVDIAVVIPSECVMGYSGYQSRHSPDCAPAGTQTEPDCRRALLSCAVIGRLPASANRRELLKAGRFEIGKLLKSRSRGRHIRKEPALMEFAQQSISAPQGPSAPRLSIA